MHRMQALNEQLRAFFEELAAIPEFSQQQLKVESPEFKKQLEALEKAVCPIDFACAYGSLFGMTIFARFAVLTGAPAVSQTVCRCHQLGIGLLSSHMPCSLHPRGLRFG